MKKNKETKKDLTDQCIDVLKLMKYLQADMAKRKVRIPQYQYWDFIFQWIKKEYSEIRKNAILELNITDNGLCSDSVETIFCELEDTYEVTANIFLEKKMIIQEHTTYFELPRRKLSLQAKLLIYQKLFKELGIKAIKIKVKKDIT